MLFNNICIRKSKFMAMESKRIDNYVRILFKDPFKLLCLSNFLSFPLFLYVIVLFFHHIIKDNKQVSKHTTQRLLTIIKY